MSRRGFTLSELLIALAILGVIATFTIPKILSAQRKGAWVAVAKEAMATVSESYVRYKQSNQATSATTPTDFTQYMNYVRVISTGSVDHYTGNLDVDCSWSTCLRLHNGAVIHSNATNTFGGTSRQRYIMFAIDPDGTFSGSLSGPGKSLGIMLFYNGRISTIAERVTGDATAVSGIDQAWADTPEANPDWFSW